MIHFLGTFVGRFHEAKEEQVLFPALVDHGGDVDAAVLATLRAEHAEGQALLVSLRGAPPRQLAATVRTYGTLMRNHLQREGTTLFPVVTSTLSGAEDDAVTAGFATLERAFVGTGAPEALEGLATALEQACAGIAASNDQPSRGRSSAADVMRRDVPPLA